MLDQTIPHMSLFMLFDCQSEKSGSFDPMNITNDGGEAHLQAALKAVLDSETTASGRPVFSLRAAAKQYDVIQSTLTAKYNEQQIQQNSHIY